MEIPFKINGLQQRINESLEYARNNPPTYLSGENKTINHEIFEMNELYLGALEKLKQFEIDKKLDDEDNFSNTQDLNDPLLSVIVEKIRGRRKNCEIRKQIEMILKLDEKLNENYATLNTEKLERKSVQDQICAILKQEESDRNALKFLEIFDENYKDGRVNKKEKEIKTKQENKNKGASQLSPLEEEIDDQSGLNKIAKESSENDLSHTSAENANKNFVKRNIKLAKNSSQITCSLTDEEEGQLEDLLKDLDYLNEGCIDNDESAHEGVLENPFTLKSAINENSFHQLEEINEKLKLFKSEDLQVPSKDCSDFIEKNERDGKFWKNEQRLKIVEEKLKQLQEEEDAAEKQEEDRVDIDINSLINFENLIFSKELYDLNNDNEE